jgi:ABC-type bacteriocin/lantibiotic exporter with double-glycine peptidase domain
VQNNILFGLPEDARKLKEVVRCSGLRADVERMPAGLETVVAEKGRTLSGEQCKRPDPCLL